MLLLQVLVSTAVASRGLGPRALIVLAASVCTVWSSSAAGAEADGYYGKLVGALSELHHGVSGTVYAVDARTLHIRDFTYDGEGPDAFFYAGTSKAPSGSGFRIRDEKGTLNVLKRYRKKHVTLTLPEGKTLANIRWFSVWCREFSVNFGDVKIPKGFDFPKPHKLGALSGIHGVSSEAVVVVDAQTMLVPNFSYDGEAPDAKFWVGPGTKPTPQGIRVADENGRFEPLKRYDRKTLVITLPGSLTVHEIGHFGVWCEAFAVDFAHVEIPSAVAVPPSLRMLGVSPQKPKTLDDVAQVYPISSESYLLENSPNRRSFHQPTALEARSPIEQQISATTYKPDLQVYLTHKSATSDNSHHQYNQHIIPQALTVSPAPPTYVSLQQSIDQSQIYQTQNEDTFVQHAPVNFYPHPQQAYYIGQQPIPLQYNNPNSNNYQQQQQQEQPQQQQQRQQYISHSSATDSTNTQQQQQYPSFIQNTGPTGRTYQSVRYF